MVSNSKCLILETYQQLLNLQDATFSKIDHNDAMVAAVYKVTKPNGEQLILKISERAPDYFRELYFLQLFAKVIPVPKIILTIEPHEKIHGAILMEYFPGTLLATAELTEPLAYEIGSTFARIHCVRKEGYGDPVQGILNSETYQYNRQFLEAFFKEAL